MRLTNINPIKTIQDIDIDSLKAKDLNRIFMTRKQYAVVVDDETVHLTDYPKRLICDKYSILHTYRINIYDLTI